MRVAAVLWAYIMTDNSFIIGLLELIICDNKYLLV